ncbi:helix-turn-helix protein [Mucilaginibacter yixingensis]|uniref:Helix-turn-helix protein n=1 Tax=Mucilaginibacter yixingensis TaxID=1295612 RepID=A0A2T5JAF4_9SPHI|nr:helix-turn-helix transcriptional regulator [Mucilaginibacter yixingensis]PTQ97845.1 helix-turn-helix protein [Mucilaginibacter yixingensis]
MAEAKKTDLDLFIVQRVKEMRAQKKWSQAVIASKLEISNGFFAQIENPKHRAKYNIAHLNKLAKIFNCSPRDFLPEQPM